MRRIKYLIWFVIAALLLTFIYQNWTFFTEQKTVGLNLYFDEYNTPLLPSGIYYIIVFAVGMLVSYFLGLSKRFQNRKTIRNLKEQIAVDERRISELETRLAEAPHSRALDVSADPKEVVDSTP